MNPSIDDDLYGEAVRQDPYPTYKVIRDLGDAVWLTKHEMWAVSRFDDVRAALRADEALVSSRGVAANALMNSLVTPTTLISDGDTHARRRRILRQPLMPGPLKALRSRLEAEADQLVEGLADGETFDAMPRFAAHLPVTVVAELVGLNEEGRRNMLRWAADGFNAVGVLNELGTTGMPAVTELGAYIDTLNREMVADEGWAARLFDAAERGDITAEEARAMVLDYVAPALDTTILATGHMLWRLATTDGAYQAVLRNPELIPGVVNESVRLASPIRGFTRFAQEPFRLGDTTIPEGARILVLFASANRDERHYPDPDTFKVDRNPRDHVGWGHGPHLCVGMHLARLEMEVLLGALVRHVGRVETDEPTPIRNNVLQGFEALPARFFA